MSWASRLIANVVAAMTVVALVFLNIQAYKTFSPWAKRQWERVKRSRPISGTANAVKKTAKGVVHIFRSEEKLTSQLNSATTSWTP